MPLFLRKMVIIFLISQTGLVQAAAGGGTSTSHYYSISPAFIVNVVDGSSVRHMQVTTQLHAIEISEMSQIDAHKAAIQHALIMLFSGKNVSTIKTVAGKEQLRKDALAAVQEVMQKNVGKPVIDEVYFTEFIIQ